MNPAQLIEATDIEVTSPEFTVAWNEPVSLIMHGTLAETLVIQFQLADETWQAILNTTMELTPTRNTIQLTAIGRYRVYKPVTAGDVGVDIITNDARQFS